MVEKNNAVRRALALNAEGIMRWVEVEGIVRRRPARLEDSDRDLVVALENRERLVSHLERASSRLYRRGRLIVPERVCAINIDVVFPPYRHTKDWRLARHIGLVIDANRHRLAYPELVVGLPLAVEKRYTEDPDLQVTAAAIDLLLDLKALLPIELRHEPVGYVGVVFPQNVAHGALGTYPALVHPNARVAKPLHGRQVVRDEENRLALLVELHDFVQRFLLERLVADSERLVNDQDVWPDVDCDGEAQSHVHPGGVGLDRHVDELLELRKLDYPVEALMYLTALETKDGAVQKHVLTARELGMKPSTQLKKRRDTAPDQDFAHVRLDDPSRKLKKRALASTILADDPHHGATWNAQSEVLKRPEILPRSLHASPEREHDGLQARCVPTP